MNDDYTPEEYEIARLAVEDILIKMRDARISTVRGNGLVCREKDGSHSDIIRMGFEQAMQVAVAAILEHRRQRARPA